MLAVDGEQNGALGAGILNDWISRVLKASPHCLEPISRLSPGHAENGTYKDGWLEYLQADRFDMMLSFVRLDFFTAPEAILIGPTLFPADGAIISKEQGTVKEDQTIAKSISNLEKVSLWYIFFTAVVLLAVLILSCTLLDQYGRLPTIVTTVWLVIRCSLFQHNVNPTYLHQKIAFLALSCLMFFTIIGYFLGLMSTDQVASYPKRAIDTLEDLLDPEFSMYEPTLSDSLYLYDNFKRADPRSVVGRVHAKLVAKRYANVITIYESAIADETGLAMAAYLPTTLRLLQETMDSKRVILFEKVFLEILRYGACLMNNTLDLHESKDAYLPGLFAATLSPKINPLMRSYLQQRLGMLLESGIQEMALAAFRAMAPQMAGKQWTSTMAKCAAGITDQLDYSIEPLRLTYLFPLVRFLLYSWAVALLVAMLEMAYHLSCDRHGRRFNWKSLAYMSGPPMYWASRIVVPRTPARAPEAANLPDAADWEVQA
ncbi:hypothetical protein HDE_05252 [Halotydeus destructor]|nr:hypothetical protein HDE_05252 [Halotydeus destructor]